MRRGANSSACTALSPYEVGALPCCGPGLRVKASVLSELVKLKITAASALTTALGFVLAQRQTGVVFCLTVGGTFLLACASAALNEIQEAGIDRRMMRTAARPIPAGRITKGQAMIIAIFLTLAGSGCLMLCGNLVPFYLGLSTMAWYNLVYTYLKRVSALAVLPGALTGAIPPLIGWTAAGGTAADPRVLALAVFFFFWQIPHFWVLALLYRGDYLRAGLPSLENLFSAAQIKRLTFVWLLAAAVSGLLLPLTGAAGIWFTPAYLLCIVPLLIYTCRNLWISNYGRVFTAINLFMLATLSILFTGV